MNFQLVKMEGDYVQPVPKWNVLKRLVNAIRGKKEMPANPINHPDCLEVIEGTPASSRVVYRRGA